MSIEHAADPRLNVVLLEPEIPQNAGNAGRTCVALGARLHLVGRLGFSLSDRDLKRAGLDYWPKLDLLQHDGWEAFERSLPASADLAMFSTKGRLSFWDRGYRAPLYLVFGSESRGFPPSFYERYASRLVRIPSSRDVRSLNLATAVGIAAYEAARALSIIPE